MVRRVPAKVQGRRFLRMVLPVAAALFIGLLVILVFVTYRLTHPTPAAELVNPSHYLLPSMDVQWASRDGAEFAGWWIPGQKGAAALLLSPGYGMSRSDALSLANALHQEGFHVLTYDTRGSGAVPSKASTLGLRDPEDMLWALDFLRTRPGVNADRVGIWGVDLSARAALIVAGTRSEVRAVAADSAYDTVADFIGARIREDFDWDSWWVDSSCRAMFQLFMLAPPRSLSEALPVQALGNKSILFITGENRRELGRLTAALYGRVQPQKELTALPISRTRRMSGEELNNYDRQVVSFFQLNLR